MGDCILKILKMYMKISNFPISVDKKTCLKTHFFYPGKPSLATPQNIDFGNFEDKKRQFALISSNEKIQKKYMVPLMM